MLIHLRKRLAIALALGVVLFATGAAVTIGPRNLLGMIRYDRRAEGRLRVGDRAPDVALVGLDGTTPVRISDRIGPRPLVLVFGSYT